MSSSTEEKRFRDELTKHGYRCVSTRKYVGISMVGGVHCIFLHDSGVLAYFDFETDAFEVNDNFGKNPKRAAKEDAIPKDVRRAQIYIVVPDKDVLASVKYLESKFDVEYLPVEEDVIAPRASRLASFTFDYYENQIDKSGRHNTVADLFHVIGDVPTMNLLKHRSPPRTKNAFFAPQTNAGFFPMKKPQKLLSASA